MEGVLCCSSCCWGRRRQGRLWQVRAIASSFHGKWFLHACRSGGWADAQYTPSMDQPTFVKPRIDGLIDWPSDLLNPNSNPFHKWHIFRQRMTTSKLAMKERHLVLLHGGDCIRPASGSKPNEPHNVEQLDPGSSATCLWPRPSSGSLLGCWTQCSVYAFDIIWLHLCIHAKGTTVYSLFLSVLKPSRAIAAWFRRLWKTVRFGRLWLWLSPSSSILDWPSRPVESSCIENRDYQRLSWIPRIP